MSLAEQIVLAIGLSMDAAAVSISNAISYKRIKKKKIIIIALLFGIFQGLMPLIGFYAVAYFKTFISKFAHWIALIILGYLGNKMLFSALKEKKENEKKVTVIEKAHSLTYNMIFIQAIATSIDALAAGISLAALNVPIFKAVILIISITFVICLGAMIVTKIIGSKIKDGKVAEIIGGIILILIGAKIFIENIFF